MGSSLLVSQLLVRHLIANAGVAALVNGAVHSEHLVDDEEANGATYPLLIVSIEGGSSSRDDVVDRLAVTIWSYSRMSSDEARRVYDAARDALHAEKIEDTAVGPVVAGPREVEAAVSGKNDRLRAWYRRGRFAVTAVHG